MAGAVDVNAGSWEAEVAGASTPVLVDFWHDSCVWCRKLAPVYEELAREFSGRVKFAKLNTFSSEENNRLADEFGVRGTPTLIFFCDGKPLESLVGYRSKDVLRKEVQHLLENYGDCLKQHTPRG